MRLNEPGCQPPRSYTALIAVDLKVIRPPRTVDLNHTPTQNASRGENNSAPLNLVISFAIHIYHSSRVQPGLAAGRGGAAALHERGRSKGGGVGGLSAGLCVGC